MGARRGRDPQRPGRVGPRLEGKAAARAYYEQALAILEQIGAVDYARVVRGNLEALKAEQQVRLENVAADGGATDALADAAPPRELAPVAADPVPVPAARKRRWWRFGR